MGLPSVAVVSTSINRDPAVYREWASVGEPVTLIVAGDVNSPPELEHNVRDAGGVYLSPTTFDIDWSDTIGYRNIQRRNAAIWHAMLVGFEYVLTVDDDNYPVDGAAAFIEGHTSVLTENWMFDAALSSRSGFLNPGTFCRPQFHGRGVPYGVNTDSVVKRLTHGRPKIVVSQAQIIGDPDCHAVERLTNPPSVEVIACDAIIYPGTYAAFNSQATMWTREWAPVMAVLPGIGRYDDIFASFIFARLAREYNVTVSFGYPLMRQDRNPHDYANDLRAEVWGMKHTITFCEALDRAHISSDMPIHVAYSELIAATTEILPKQTVKFAQQWVKSWRDIL